MKNIFSGYDINIVLSFAGESHVDPSIYGIKDFIQSNIMGTFNLLELTREVWKKEAYNQLSFHHIITDEFYSSVEEGKYFFERTACKPNSSYCASKASSDRLVRSYFKTYALRINISNCPNNYGHYQYPKKLIPQMILDILEEKHLPVYGDGKI